MNFVKNAPEDLSTITDPEYLLLTKIWRQVQSKSEGEGSAQTIDDILNMVDDESLQELFTDPDLQMTTEFGPVTKRVLKQIFKIIFRIRKQRNQQIHSQRKFKIPKHK